MKQIAFVMGDIGSAKEMMLVAPELEKEGVVIRYFADPKGKAASDVLGSRGLVEKTGFETLVPEEVVETGFDAIVIGTSATANSLQVAWTRYGKENSIPVLWIEDLYGTGSRKNSQEVSPDVMLVIDEIAAKIARTIRPDLNVEVVGKPTFGSLPSDEEAVAVRTAVRTDLGLKDSDFFVTISFGGDPAERSETQLPQIIEALAKIFGYKITVAWRFHPKHPRKEDLWQTAVSGGLLYVDARKVDLDKLNIASDAVVADWGNTDPYKALLYGVPVVTMLFPDDTQRRLDVGYPEGIPPILMTSPEWGAKDVYGVAGLLYFAMAGELTRKLTRFVRATPFMALRNPCAEKRMAEAILKYAL